VFAFEFQAAKGFKREGFVRVNVGDTTGYLCPVIYCPHHARPKTKVYLRDEELEPGVVCPDLKTS